MNLLVGSLTVGLILSLLAIEGVYISFRIFTFADMTAGDELILSDRQLAQKESRWCQKDRRRSTYTARPHQQSLFFDAKICLSKYALTGKNITHILQPVKSNALSIQLSVINQSLHGGHDGSFAEKIENYFRHPLRFDCLRRNNRR